MSEIRKSVATELRAVAALPAAGAWDLAAAALEALVTESACVTFFVDYVQGAGGGACEVLFEGSPVSSGDDWYPLEEATDEAAAVLSGQSLPIPVRTASMVYVGTQKAPGHTVRLGGFERVRARGRETGAAGTPGTLRVRVRGSTGDA